MDEDKTLQDKEIVDAEIVEEITSSEAANGDATVLLSLDSMIKSHIKSLDKLSVELKQKRQMLEDTFANDPIFREHAENAKKAAKIKSETRSQIMKQPQVAQLSNKVKELSSEIKTRKLELSDYLLEYQRMSGVNQIEGDDGDVREIVNEAKLIKRTSKN